MVRVVSLNPSTGKVLATLKPASVADAKRAVAGAKRASQSWRELPYGKRARCLLKVAHYFQRNERRLARLLNREQGKPMREAVDEARKLAPRIKFFVNATKQFLREEQRPATKYGTNTVVYEPIGVVAVISPWNFPLSNPLLSTCPALLAGNTVVFKPSEVTPLLGLEIGKAFAYAKMPKGVFTTLVGSASTGKALVSGDVDKVAFTGSVAAGKDIMANSAGKLHSLTLELGGKNPMIVLEDANLEEAANGAVWGACYNTGQFCAAIGRIYAHEKIFGDFAWRIAHKARALRKGIDFGPLVSKEQLAKVEAHVKDAVKKGARVLCGGGRIKGKGFFYKPTVLVNVNHKMRVMREETFGPVLPIMPFRSDAEAVRFANASRYGLCASVWGRNKKRAWGMARRIESGMVWINDTGITNDLCPWGGVKESGIGRVRAAEGIREFANIKWIYKSTARSSSRDWWFSSAQ